MPRRKGEVQDGEDEDGDENGDEGGDEDGDDDGDDDGPIKTSLFFERVLKSEIRKVLKHWDEGLVLSRHNVEDHDDGDDECITTERL